AASAALASGSTNARPSRCALSVIASAPRIGRSSPVNASSPANSYPANPAAGTCPVAARMPRAIGRSNRPDSLGRSAGARLTVTLRDGNSNWAFCSAARTRSRLSLTSVSGSPTRLNAGNPPARCTSTATGGASNPESARLCRTATGITYRRELDPRTAAPVPPSALLGARPRFACFELGDPRLQRLELFPRAQQDLRLKLEFL